MAEDFSLQLIEAERLLRLEALANLDGAEVFQKGPVDKGVGAPADRAEHEVSPAQLIDERTGGTVRTQIRHAFEAAGKRVFESSLVDQIAGETALARLHSARDMQEQSALVFVIKRGLGQLRVRCECNIDLPLVKE